MVQGIQYTACAEKEQSFKESMREKVEHAKARTIHGSGCNAHTYEHVAKLANGRERQYSFEVGLCESNSSSKNR